jgi:hypothetical protein
MSSPLPSISEITSAIRSANEHPHTLNDDELQRLASTLRASYDDRFQDAFDVLNKNYASATDDGNDLQQDIVVAFSRLQNGACDWIVTDLIRYFERDPQFYELAHALLALSFPATTIVDDLFARGNMQREVLSAIIRNTAIWRSDMTLADHLAERGLPISRGNVANLIASTENVG